MNPQKLVLRIPPILKLIESLEEKVDEEQQTPKLTPAKKRPLPSEAFKSSTMSLQKKPKIISPSETDQISEEPMELAETKQPTKKQPNFKANFLVKDLLAEYMKAYNFKANGFSFEKLDAIIHKIEESTIGTQPLAILLANHYINNNFIPLDELKTHQQDSYELNLYRDLHTLFQMKEKMGHTSQMHLAYKQNKV